MISQGIVFSFKIQKNVGCCFVIGCFVFLFF